MSITTTAGRALLNAELPPEFRDYDRELIGGSFKALLTRIAREQPKMYLELSKKLSDLGREISFKQGSTMRLEDLKTPIANRDEIVQQTRAAQRAIERDTALTDGDKTDQIRELFGNAQEQIVNETMAAAIKAKNPLAMQVLSGARGNPMQLAAILSTPAQFSDAKGKPIPIFVGRSYSQGLTPAEYYAATFGARQGVISTKMATREAGDLGKQLSVASEGLIVTEDDCGTLNGIPVPVGDDESVGALLARNVDNFDMGTPVTGKIWNSLKKNKVSRVLVRSPVTCQAKRGICKRCAGKREDGEFPALRDAIGIKAGSALSERIAQGALNVKHSGGQKGKAQTYAGFPMINQFAQVPGTFRHQAALADLDGEVDAIQEAPQGGWNVIINEQSHYVAPDQEVMVKPGDAVEAGDQLGSGLINPSQIVQYKGIGEGRRYFAERFAQLFKDSKLPAHRRNVEVVARALIDHVDVDDDLEEQGFLPGDVASYSQVASRYRPRQDATVQRPRQAYGRYLEQPYLHHTIGTRVTNRMIKELEEFGVDQVNTHTDAPAFTPRMIRLRAVPHYDKDWMAKLHGSYLTSNLLQDAQTGATSNIHSTNPIPGVAYGREFGESKTDEVTF